MSGEGASSGGEARPLGGTRGSLFGTELATRTVSALVLAAVVIAATLWGGWPFALIWLVAAIAMAVEWTTITRTAPRHPVAGICALALCAVAAAAMLRQPLLAAAGLGLGAVAILALAADGRSRAWGVAGLAYAAVIAAVPALLRDDPRIGLVGPLWLFGIVWTTDIAAYFTGRTLGGPKLWPAVSPKKTWSGFFGGVTAGTIAGSLIVAEAGRRGFAAPPLWATILVSAVGAALGQMGDLAESALKRAFGVKDSGNTIPGHGGFMDRLDAFWAAAAIAGLARLVWTPA